ncbi:MAG: C-terminal binding protein [Oligoflexia bacterium]|nr:C-terminal binding protein [Oligoflexia bacterium]
MKKKYKVVISEGKRPSMYLKHIENIKKEIFGEDFEVILAKDLEEETLIEKIVDADSLIIRPGMMFTSKSIKKLKQCQCIVSLAVGYDHIDIDCASKQKIKVCNVPDYGCEEVADTAIALLLNAVRKIGFYNTVLKENICKWDWQVGIPMHRLRSQKLGIIGLGRIGSAVAVRAKAFGMDVCYFDPYKECGYDKSLGISRIEAIEDLLSSSDIITIHTPLNEETKGMVNRSFIEKMKRGAILLNTARGAIFDSLDTIYFSLQNEILSFVATDVLPIEPPIDGKHLLLESWSTASSLFDQRLVITPHMAFYSEEASYELCCKAAVAARNSVLGKRVDNIINSDKFLY